MLFDFVVYNLKGRNNKNFSEAKNLNIFIMDN